MGGRPMKKLDLKHICPYLPHGLQGQFPDRHGYPQTGVITNLNFGIETTLTVENDEIDRDINLRLFKPALIPLSAVKGELLDRIVEMVIAKDPELRVRVTHIIRASMSETVEQTLNSDPFFFPYFVLEILFSEHIDVFGLLDAGLAVNKLELEVKK